MNIFNEYADFYDFLYEDKDYSAESTYIKNLIQKNTTNAKTILDVGCGTGIHSTCLAKEGFTVCGVDLSKQMLKYAEERKSYFESDVQARLDFIEGDARKLKLDKRFDAVVSLFHVMSYQTSNMDVTDVLNTVKSHLNTDGIFIFDFWYGPGVLTEPPQYREKMINKNSVQCKRIAKPILKSDQNQVEISYTLKNDDNNSAIKETHNMRYFFKPEIELFLKITGFELCGFYEWMTLKTVNLNTWNAVVIAKLNS